MQFLLTPKQAPLRLNPRHLCLQDAKHSWNPPVMHITCTPEVIEGYGLSHKGQPWTVLTFS